MIRLYIPILCGILLPVVVEAQQEAPKWERLDNCRLTSSPLNDGDSFVISTGAAEHLFRLYLVDCPEVSGLNGDRVRDQADYFGISPNAAVKAGVMATEFTKRFLKEPFSVHTLWKKAWGSHERYAAFIECGGKSLGDALVENGLARIDGFHPAVPWRGKSANEIDSKVTDSEFFTDPLKSNPPSHRSRKMSRPNSVNFRIGFGKIFQENFVPVCNLGPPNPSLLMPLQSF